VDEEHRQSWAQFRFEVIAPLLDDKLDGAEKAGLRQQVLAKTYTTPDGKSWRIAERKDKSASLRIAAAKRTVK
jgi:hypothetical protein